MKINNSYLSRSIRELPVSLQLNNRTKYRLPISNDGYIINPKNLDTKIDEIDFKDIKYLLIMMLRGNPNFIENLVKTDSSKFVNTSV